MNVPKRAPAASTSSADDTKSTSAENHKSKKQKMTEKKTEFPCFDGGDTVISLSAEKTQDLLLHRIELRRMSGYFAAFSDTEWPERFELTAGKGGCQVKPATENSRSSSQPCSNVDLHLDSRMHELFFRMLYRQPISFLDLALPPEQVLLKLTYLTKVYDCLNHVKDQLTAEIYTGDHFGGEKIAKQPDVFLVIANHLQNKRLFREALLHVVGQSLKRNEEYDWGDSLDKIVNKCAEDLESRVKKTCVSLYTLKTSPALPDFVACSIFRKFLLLQLAPKRLASGEMFATFQYLHRLVSGSELIEATDLEWLVNSVAIIPRSVRKAIDFLEEQGDDQDCQPSLDGLYNVEDLEFRPSQIKAALKKLVVRAQNEIRPWMASGPDYGYFTQVDLKDIYPWEEVASKSPEAS